MTQALVATMPSSLAQPLADTLETFKQGVDNLLAKRSYFISQVLPKLKENQDYYEIKGKKSLGKGGAEKLASIYNLTATFERDDQTMSAFSSVKDMIAYVCSLFKADQLVGQGRGAATLVKNQGDVNKTIKMSTKSAFIDAVIRTTGLSDIFTQDVEDMAETQVLGQYTVAGHNAQVDDQTPLKSAEYPSESASSSEYGFVPATDKQKSYLNRLVSQRCVESEELEEQLKVVEGLSKFEASQMIEELLNC